MRTINLLPTAGRRYAGLPPGALLRSLVGFLIILLIAVTSWLTIVKNQLLSLATSEKKKIATLTEKLEHTNQSQTDLALILDRQKSWQALEKDQTNSAKILRGVAAATPGSLRLTSLTSGDKGSLGIAGTASSRNEVSLFIAHLNQVGLFQNVTLNLANAQAEGVLFNLSLELIKAEVSPAPIASIKPTSLPANPTSSPVATVSPGGGQ